MSCYGCSPSTGTNASSFPDAPSRACVSQQPATQLYTEFHFRSAPSSCARCPASQPAHRNTARCGLSSDALAELLAKGAVIATQALSAGPAFRSRSAAVARCVRRQHLIVAPTNPGAQPALQYAHSSTKNCGNPSLTDDIEAPHISPPFCPLHHHPLFGHVNK